MQLWRRLKRGWRYATEETPGTITVEEVMCHYGRVVTFHAPIVCSVCISPSGWLLEATFALAGEEHEAYTEYRVYELEKEIEEHIKALYSEYAFADDEDLSEPARGHKQQLLSAVDVSEVTGFGIMKGD